MNFALRYPSAVSRLIVVDVAPVDYPPFDKFNSYIEMMKALDLAKLTSRKDADEYFKSLVPVSICVSTMHLYCVLAYFVFVFYS